MRALQTEAAGLRAATRDVDRVQSEISSDFLGLGDGLEI
jgi:hypothetical protein